MNKLDLLIHWEEFVNTQESILEKILEAGFAGESSLCSSIMESLDVQTKAFSLLVGDKHDWLGWYWLENDLGGRGLEAGYKDDMFPIRSVYDLLKIIGEDNE